jgi:hypothetical protein
LLETLPAEDRTALRRLKGNCSFLATLGAVGSGFYLGIITRGGCTQAGGSLRLTGFASFGLVLELFVMEEQLFSRREYKVSIAVNTLQNLILEFHGELLPSARESPSTQRGYITTGRRNRTEGSTWAVANSGTQVHLPGFGPPCLSAWHNWYNCDATKKK